MKGTRIRALAKGRLLETSLLLVPAWKKSLALGTLCPEPDVLSMERYVLLLVFWLMLALME